MLRLADDGISALVKKALIILRICAFSFSGKLHGADKFQSIVHDRASEAVRSQTIRTGHYKYVAINDLRKKREGAETRNRYALMKTILHKVLSPFVFGKYRCACSEVALVIFKALQKI